MSDDIKIPKDHVIVLYPHDGGNATYHIVPQSRLDIWLNDGSIQDGCLVVDPTNVRRVQCIKTLALVKEG
jgi:hypothetical protein